MRQISSFLAAALVVGTLAVPAAAQPEVKPEEAVKMRQGLLTAMKWQFAPIVAVAKGEEPFSEQVVARARNLAALARMAAEGFPAGSGVDVVRSSRAKPSIWTSDQKFAATWSTMVTEAERLMLVAQNRDAGQIRNQVAAVANVCKDCHDAFRAE